jgi:YbgC/YbaW family acyl-CoA thioester hydrolase
MSNIRKIKLDRRVAWSDTDTGGVVYYGAYCRWVEYAEAELWREAGVPLSESFDRFDIWLPRIEFNCKYMRPLRYDDPVEVCLHIERWDAVSLTYGFEIIRGVQGDNAARGELRVATVDRKVFQARELPEEVRVAFDDAGFLPPRRSSRPANR